MTPRKPLPSRERLRELFDYHEDGYLVRRVKVGTRYQVGDRVRGKLNKSGYLEVRVDGLLYKFHRIVFQWHRGWCPVELDHDDRCRTNCRIGNLKPSTRSGNMLNTGLQSNNTSGVRAVSLCHGRWRAAPVRDGICHRLGFFDTVEEAGAAIVTWEQNR